MGKGTRKKVAWLLALLSLAAAVGPWGAAAAAEANVRVFLDGRPLSFEKALVLADGYTLVPMRAIFEALGAEVAYESDTKTVTAVREYTTIRYTIGEREATKNGDRVTLPAAGRLLDGVTYVPLRFVARSFGSFVSWEGGSNAVIVSTPPKHAATVEEVVDARTLKVSFEQEGVYTVRLIGVSPLETYREEADAYAAERLAPGSLVWLETDEWGKELDGTIRAYVFFTEGAFYNAELVAQGYASALAEAPNSRWDALFAALEADARRANRGGWAVEPTSPQAK